MKRKNIYLIVMVIVIIILLLEQAKELPSVWIQVVGIVLFFYGMMKLSAKTPSKNNENEE